MNELPPPWLAEDLEVTGLLHAVLDRFDAQPGSTRQRSISLRVEEHVSSLGRGDASADQTWALIGELAALGVCVIRAAKRSDPYEPSWRDAKLAFAPSSEPVLRAWLQRDISVSALQSWRAAVEARAHEFAVAPEALLVRRIAIVGRTDEEIVAALLDIASIDGSLSLRQLSARVFWGNSKVLDDRGDLIRTLFPHIQLRERPVVASVHLPESIDEILFIENQDTYAVAVSGALPATERAAFVYAAGFRSTAARIRSREGALLHYAGPGAERHRQLFERYWFVEVDEKVRLSFWGDLDFAGMQILKSLRARFGGVRAWLPGYEPMVRALRENIAHRVDDRAQIDPGSTGCEYADGTLLPIIRSCGYLDQEWFLPPERPFPVTEVTCCSSTRSCYRRPLSPF